MKHCEKEKYKVGGVGDKGTEFTTAKSRVISAIHLLKKVA